MKYQLRVDRSHQYVISMSDLNVRSTPTGILIDVWQNYPKKQGGRLRERNICNNNLWLFGGKGGFLFDPPSDAQIDILKTLIFHVFCVHETHCKIYDFPPVVAQGHFEFSRFSLFWGLLVSAEKTPFTGSLSLFKNKIKWINVFSCSTKRDQTAHKMKTFHHFPSSWRKNGIDFQTREKKKKGWSKT